MPNRLEKLRAQLDSNGIDGILITQPDNRYYLSGFNGTAGYLMITSNKAILATDFRYTEQALSEAPDFEILRIANSVSGWLPDLVKSIGIRRLGFESPDVTHQAYTVIKDSLKKADVAVELVPLNGIVEAIRVVKTKEEISRIEAASVITDRAYEEVAAILHAGMTELQVAWELEKRLREYGSQALPFEIIVASGPKAALPHAKPSERIINDGDPVVIDMGARYEWYASDMSRTLCCGAATDMMKKIYTIVLDAQMAALSIIKSGISGGEADAAARKVIQKAGHDENFGHSLGHGVGLAAHEQPRLSPGSNDILGEGMVFTVEPGIYLSGWGGVRIEDTVVIENGAMRTLTKAGKVHYD